MTISGTIMKVFNNAVLAVRGTTVAEALKPPAAEKSARPAAVTVENPYEYDPDAEFESLSIPVLSPVVAFHEALRAEDPSKLPDNHPYKNIKVKVAEAWIYEGVFDEHGKLATKKVLEARGIPWPVPYLIRHISSDAEYRQKIESAKAEWDTHLPNRINESKKRKAVQESVRKRLLDAKLIEQDVFDFGGWGGPNGVDGPFDPNQYTEYAPTYGGPFFKQLYLTDYLRMHSLAFEAWNHNPIAKRVIELMAQYSFGRRFKVRIKDKKKLAIWKQFDEKYQIRENASKYWVREYCIYGEIMINLETWMLIDPSTVWDIITDPDNLREVYYYYQSYPTAYQQFTGIRVPGEPGSEKVPGQEYIIRQIPAYKVLHKKGNCVSNEKRGRSLLFPILGWLKRIKDLYNAVVVRQWLLSCFIWDDTVKGSAADISAHAAQYARMPTPGSTFVHNESVTRQAMPAIDTAGGKSTGSGIGSEIIAFIATAVGIPKEFLNVIQGTGGGSRATALTSAEPFTKVIEDLQATFEDTLITIVQFAFEQAGVEYQEGDVEFIFPSVTKDTTTETIKNIATGEALGYISKQTAGEMFAAELNITNYDFLNEQGRIDDEIEQGLNKNSNPPTIPPGRLGADTGVPGDWAGDGQSPSEDEDEGSEIHGQGKVALTHQLKTL